MPRVTVGVPVLNGDTLIESALQNLADQTYRDKRVVIMENTITDSGTAIGTRCRPYIINPCLALQLVLMHL
jgi:hypothetical protein